mmetsp:Transcript_16407/g.50227  ORF Transcript_16407/g.50227 Transcript_16407/m.50227 type:complete len:217 (+) Transcript_16407:1308-1958(+)
MPEPKPKPKPSLSPSPSLSYARVMRSLGWYSTFRFRKSRLRPSKAASRTFSPSTPTMPSLASVSMTGRSPMSTRMPSSTPEPAANPSCVSPRAMVFARSWCDRLMALPSAPMAPECGFSLKPCSPPRAELGLSPKFSRAAFQLMIVVDAPLSKSRRMGPLPLMFISTNGTCSLQRRNGALNGAVGLEPKGPLLASSGSDDRKTESFWFLMSRSMPA